MENKKMIKLTGLWYNTDKNGEGYYSGTLGGAKVFIFPNKFKEEGSKQPDMNVFISEYNKEDK